MQLTKDQQAIPCRHCPHLWGEHLYSSRPPPSGDCLGMQLVEEGNLICCPCPGFEPKVETPPEPKKVNRLFWVKCRGAYSLEVSVIRAETEEEARSLFVPTSPGEDLKIEVRELTGEGDPEEVINAVYME